MPVRLFVGNLPYTAHEAEIREHFAAVAEPSRLVIPVDRETGRARGFAFAEFDDPAVAETVIRQLDGQPFKGRPLAITQARPRDERSPVSHAARPDAGGSPAAAGRPMRENAGRTFGPDKKPRRPGAAGRRYESARAPKGPLRERGGGRMFSVDEDSRDVAPDVEDDVATRDPDAEPNTDE